MKRKYIMLLEFAIAAVISTSGGCLHSPVAFEEPPDFAEDFKQIFIAFQYDYPLFDHKGIDWISVGAEYYPLVTECTSREEFYSVLGDMLAILEDETIYYETFEGEPEFYHSPEDLVYPWQNEYTPNVDYDVLMNNYLALYGFQPCSLGFSFCDPQLLPYALVDTLSEGVSGAIDEFVSQCNSLALPALILDLRVQERSYMNSDTLAGRFTDRIYGSYMLRSRDGPDYWNYWDVVQYVKTAGPQQFTGTVIVLMGEQNRGKSERLCADFGYNDSVVLVGDTTMGSVSFTHSLTTESYINVGLPYQTVVMRDGTWLEGNGVPPDIYVPTTPGDFASGTDPVLEYAMELLQQYR